jgi:hypothetical protein
MPTIIKWLNTVAKCSRDKGLHRIKKIIDCKLCVFHFPTVYFLWKLFQKLELHSKVKLEMMCNGFLYVIEFTDLRYSSMPESRTRIHPMGSGLPEGVNPLLTTPAIRFYAFL